MDKRQFNKFAEENKEVLNIKYEERKDCGKKFKVAIITFLPKHEGVYHMHGNVEIMLI